MSAFKTIKQKMEQRKQVVWLPDVKFMVCYTAKKVEREYLFDKYLVVPIIEKADSAKIKDLRTNLIYEKENDKYLALIAKSYGFTEDAIKKGHAEIFKYNNIITTRAWNTIPYVSVKKLPVPQNIRSEYCTSDKQMECFVPIRAVVDFADAQQKTTLKVEHAIKNKLLKQAQLNEQSNDNNTQLKGF